MGLPLAVQMVNGQLDFISDTFQQLKPGLSSYDSDADSAAKSLDPLLKAAVETVPQELQVAFDALVICPVATCSDARRKFAIRGNVTRSGTDTY